MSNTIQSFHRMKNYLFSHGHFRGALCSVCASQTLKELTSAARSEISWCSCPHVQGRVMHHMCLKGPALAAQPGAQPFSLCRWRGAAPLLGGFPGSTGFHLTFKTQRVLYISSFCFCSVIIVHHMSFSFPSSLITWSWKSLLWTVGKGWAESVVFPWIPVGFCMGRLCPPCLWYWYSAIYGEDWKIVLCIVVTVFGYLLGVEVVQCCKKL